MGTASETKKRPQNHKNSLKDHKRGFRTIKRASDYKSRLQIYHVSDKEAMKTALNFRKIHQNHKKNYESGLRATRIASKTMWEIFKGIVSRDFEVCFLVPLDSSDIATLPERVRFLKKFLC
jgi:hypothetical protein